jgi:hypothetical protein
MDVGQPNQPEGQPEGQPQVPDLSGLLKDGKILGKYETPEAAAEGYWNSVNEMNSAKEKLNMAMQVIEAMQKGQPQHPVQPQVPSYEKNLETMGIPLNDLTQLVNARAEEIAGRVLQKHLNPMVQGAQAHAQMEASFPDFKENVSAILNGVKADPALASTFDALLEAGQPLAALKLGYFEWKTKSPAKPNADLEAAKRAAQSPGSAGSVGRTGNMSTGPSQADLDQAMAAHLAGDSMPLFDLKLKGIPLTYSEQMEALMRGRMN